MGVFLTGEGERIGETSIESAAGGRSLMDGGSG